VPIAKPARAEPGRFQERNTRAKNRYSRQGPFDALDAPQCKPKQDTELPKGAACPSGHAAPGRAMGQGLIEVAPDAHMCLGSAAWPMDKVALPAACIGKALSMPDAGWPPPSLRSGRPSRTSGRNSVTRKALAVARASAARLTQYGAAEAAATRGMRDPGLAKHGACLTSTPVGARGLRTGPAQPCAGCSYRQATPGPRPPTVGAAQCSSTFAGEMP
jgi:hypothetical protein